MKWSISLIVVLALVAGLWWIAQRQQAELAPEGEQVVPAEPRRPQPRHPLPKAEIHPAPGVEIVPENDDDTSAEQPRRQPAAPPLPALTESDAAARDALSGLLGRRFVERWIKPEFIIARTVAVVNSLDGPAPALKAWPLRPLESEPATEEHAGADTLLWTAANAQRYEAPITALESVSPEQAAALYVHYYPLFQQAWAELGEPEPYFNDRMIDVIDHLTATPPVELPIEVVPYEGRLNFADESLEQASWGRKLLIRMGTANARRTTDWLQRFRAAVTARPDGPESPAR